jgi:hypothetical protein
VNEPSAQHVADRLDDGVLRQQSIELFADGGVECQDQGLERSCRAARRSRAGLPLVSRSTAYSSSMRRTISAAIGAWSFPNFVCYAGVLE